MNNLFVELMLPTFLFHDISFVSCPPFIGCYNKRIKGTKPVGHEFGIWLVRKVLTKLIIGARILAPYAQGR